MATFAPFRGAAVRCPTEEDMEHIAHELGFHLEDHELQTFRDAISKSLAAFDEIDSIPDPKLPVKYPRTTGYRPPPEENQYNAWYWKCQIKGALQGRLQGKTIVIKDHICVAGVPMMIGSKCLMGYTPDEDATVVTRVLDAGGTIVGKAVCEDLCLSGNSFSAATGFVLNPHDVTREAGGSSSGCVVLVAVGEADMAIGGDQGGSIRHPSSRCGIVGLKPTFGLVPYTGACPCEFTLDHLGPMARTVHDVALLLEVMAGYDEARDSRQCKLHTQQLPSYSQQLTSDISGIRIGILREGFGYSNSEEDVDKMVRTAASQLAQQTGVAIQEVSVPMHLKATELFDVISCIGGMRVLYEGKGFGMSARGHYTTSLHQALTRGMRVNANELSANLKVDAIMGKFLHDSGQDFYYSKAQNLSMKLSEAYDEIFKSVDVLIMPTNPMKARPLPSMDCPLKERLEQYGGLRANTCPFNVTGLPALTISAGMSSGLPVGLLIVGKKYDEVTVLNTAYAYEQMRDSRN